MRKVGLGEVLQNMKVMNVTLSRLTQLVDDDIHAWFYCVVNMDSVYLVIEEGVEPEVELVLVGHWYGDLVGLSVELDPDVVSHQQRRVNLHHEQSVLGLDLKQNKNEESTRIKMVAYQIRFNISGTFKQTFRPFIKT